MTKPDVSPSHIAAVADLSLVSLRAANVTRLPLFKNRRGEAAHSKTDGSDWCLAQWMNALYGEAGELSGLIKAVDRGDLADGLETVITDNHGDQLTVRKAMAKECADILIYLDIIAYQLRIDLGQAVVEKYNEVSLRVDCPYALVPFSYDPAESSLAEVTFFLADLRDADPKPIG